MPHTPKALKAPQNNGKKPAAAYDLIIIGAGPAGLAAAVYAARQKIKFAVISKNIGGQTTQSGNVENYLGFRLLSGTQLVSKFEEHVKDYKIDLKFEEATSLQKNKRLFKVKTQKNTYQTQAILLASGKNPKKLGITGEQEFTGRGVTYCATCDAPLFFGKEVAVIGGGNSAMDSALLAAKYATKAYLITINKQLKGDAMLIRRTQKNPKITVLASTKTIGILGGKFVEKITVIQNKKEKTIPCQGVFIEIGWTPSTQFDNLTRKNKFREIIIHENKREYASNLTSVKGIFAAGDCTDVPEKQIIVASGEGVKAALAAFKHLNKKED